MLRAFAISLAMVVLTACSSAPPAPPINIGAEQAQLRDLEVNWGREVDQRDLDRIATRYADDAIFMLSGAPAVKGQAAIRGIWKEILADSNFKMTLSPDRIEVTQAGDLAVTRGGYTTTETDPKTKRSVEDKGSYVIVYKKQIDGTWKAIEDIAVSELH